MIELKKGNLFINPNQISSIHCSKKNPVNGECYEVVEVVMVNNDRHLITVKDLDAICGWCDDQYIHSDLFTDLINAVKNLER